MTRNIFNKDIQKVYDGVGGEKLVLIKWSIFKQDLKSKYLEQLHRNHKQSPCSFFNAEKKLLVGLNLPLNPAFPKVRRELLLLLGKFFSPHQLTLMFFSSWLPHAAVLGVAPDGSASTSTSCGSSSRHPSSPQLTNVRFSFPWPPSCP